MLRQRDDTHNRTIGAAVAGLAMGARGRSISGAVATSMMFAAAVGISGIFDFKLVPEQAPVPPATKPSSSSSSSSSSAH